MRELIPVSPSVLVWARRTALASDDDAAEALDRPTATVRALETGREQPTYGQLERLADEYGISANALLLPSAPPGQEPPPDFRSPSGRGHEPIGRRTRRELRRARYLQELVADLELLPTLALPRVDTRADPGSTTRAALGVDVERQRAWRNEYEALREWRAALARVGVLVLQFPLPLNEVRGMSLASMGRRPPVIVVNQSDWMNSRIFSLFHELGHLVLARDGAICDPWRHGPRSSSLSLESRCNKFAGTVLVPTEHLELERETQQLVSERDSARRVQLLKTLASRYHVSAQVIWYRVHERKLVSDKAFSELWPEIRPPIRTRQPKAVERESGIPRWRRAETAYGKDLVSAFVRAGDRGALSQSQLMRALNVGVTDLGRLQGDMSGV